MMDISWVYDAYIMAIRENSPTAADGYKLQAPKCVALRVADPSPILSPATRLQWFAAVALGRGLLGSTSPATNYWNLLDQGRTSPKALKKGKLPSA